MGENMTTQVETRTETPRVPTKFDPENISIPGERYVIKHVDPEERLPSGLYLPRSAQEEGKQTVFAKVIKVGSGRVNEKGEPVPMPLPISEGSYVILGKFAGTKYSRDESYRIINWPEILAIVPAENVPAVGTP
jgi:co-chaperonin GroES (HSP10)